jgi:hypothetical protein
MKRFSGRAHRGCALLLGLGMAVLRLAPQPAAAAAPPPRLVPFKITFAITTDRIVIPANPPIQAVRVSWSGQSDLLGPVTGISAHTNHLGVDGLPISSTEGVGVISGANGDAFFITYRGLIHPPIRPAFFPTSLPSTSREARADLPGRPGAAHSPA